MKIKSALKKIENFIAQGETLRAIRSLLDLSETLQDDSTKSQVLILSSQYHEYQRAQRLYLEADSKIPNRINKALLGICQDISAAHPDDTPQDLEAFSYSKTFIKEELAPKKKSTLLSKKNILLVSSLILGLSLTVYFLANSGRNSEKNNFLQEPEKSVQTKNTAPTKNNNKNIKPAGDSEETTGKSKKAVKKEVNEQKNTLITSKTDIKILKKAENEIEAEEYESAISLLDSALKSSSQNRDSLFFLRGIAKLNMNRYTEAIVDMNDALKINKKFASAYFYKSECLLKMGDKSLLKTARVNVEKGLLISPKNEFGLECQKRIEQKMKEEE